MSDATPFRWDDENCRLYVGNLTYSVTRAQLEELFCAYDYVKNTGIVVDSVGRSKGYGFVCMATPEGAARAMNALDGTVLEGRQLLVRCAKPRQ